MSAGSQSSEAGVEVGGCARPGTTLEPLVGELAPGCPWLIRKVPEGEGGLDLGCGITIGLREAVNGTEWRESGEARRWGHRGKEGNRALGPEAL